ncbi:MAG: methylated-DNA--[protein]-cysteine S-methyltransferase [Burkholderiaceae bacterium]
MKFDPSTVQSHYPGPLGRMILAATDQGLAGLWFEGQKHVPAALAHWPVHDQHPVLLQTAAQLDAYFAGRRTAFGAALDLRAGTPFQQAVWQALLAIPPGTTTSYGALSQAIGKPRAARAVGAAIGRNPISIVVPCHRVVGAGGTLTGYAGGLHRKTALLQLEGAY